MFEGAVFSRSVREPKAPAYVNALGTVSYRRMADDIARCAAWLKLKGVKPGQRVALHVDSVYRRWVMFFALEAIEAVSVATWDARPLSARVVALVGADFHVTSLPPSADQGTPGILLEPDWLDRLRKLRLPKIRERRRSSGDPICVVLSSGTTGLPKKVLMRRGALDERVYATDSADFWRQGTRMLMMFPVGSAGSLTAVLRGFTQGASLCSRPADLDFAQALDLFKPTLICGAPIHLDQALASLPADFSAQPSIDIGVGGGSLTPELAAALRARFGGLLATYYGSTELGFVTRCTIGDDHDDRLVGTVLPGAEVEIRDDAGQILPAGEVGEVWVRGSQVIDGYLEETEASASLFREGWFHPGDLGSLDADGLLMIHGRTDDVMNFQGFKSLPSRIEAAVRRLGLVRDVAVFSGPAPGGEAVPWVLCVAEPPVPPEAIAPAIPRVGGFMLGFVDSIPRNPMGKIDRVVLRQRAQADELDVVQVSHPRL